MKNFIQTYILTSLVFATAVHSINYHAIEHRPDFIQLKSESLTKLHHNQAKLGFGQALVSANYAKIDLDALNIIKGSKGKYINIKNTQMAGQQVSLRLPGFKNAVVLDVAAALNLSHEIDIVTYTGTVQDHKDSRFVISVSELEGIIGTINIDKHVYNILPAKRSGKYLIVKSDKSMIPRNQSKDYLESKSFDKLVKSKQSILKSGNANGLVKVLFYHTSDLSYPYTTAVNTYAEMNTILGYSSVSINNRLSLATSAISIPLGTTLSGVCRLAILNKMVDREAPFDNIDQDLLVYGADIAVTLFKGDTSATPSGTYCRVGGYGVLYGLNNGVIGSAPFAALADNYSTSSGDLTGAHEIGHVLGGKHAADNRNTAQTPLYSRGYTSSNTDFQTIMGGYQAAGCFFNGPYPPYLCERIARFSNPDPNPALQYDGQTLGVVNNRDMKSWLNSKMTGISNWTGDPLQIPSAPSLTTYNEHCYGFNGASWNSINGATEYKLYKSTTSSFQNPSLIYNGVNTSSYLNVNSGTWYLRVKACNAAGCSAYSNQATAYYYNGCQ